ncbi:MAG: WYL domain-containing transcriptional regulator [Deltaproteobacteria bacterium]|nr:WYL domain-containing transcriptional regulator [Deltaproteobacteria bacterium]
MDDRTKARKLTDLKARFEDGGRFTIGRIIEDYGVTRRTANRYINELEEMGLDFVSEMRDDGQKVWQATVRGQKLRVTYTLHDVMALFLGRTFFDFLAGTTLEERFDRVLSSVESQLSRREDQKQARKFCKKLFLVHEGPKKLPAKKRELLDWCLTGLLKEQKIRVDYVAASGSRSSLVLHPYTLVAFKRGLYLIAAVEEWGGQIYRFALERMADVEWMSGEKFEYPESYTPEKFLKSALYIQTGKPEPVEIEFTAGTRPFVEYRKYHHTQKLEVRKNGRVRLTMKVPVNDETLYWVVSFGANARVVGPKSLKEMVAAELRKAAGQY